ncbi:MAG: A/G-specific adenine glycosylase [Omnitrophica bacterium GWA2_52_8]|nr:MAG: A/G-specific adenine glycosylase [Omnitrophica bacterium GWA2_52_8]
MRNTWLQTIKTFQKKLLEWFKSNARDLPWRRTHDPYHIWVSEIMLQQTQVDTVIPYYTRWINRFPAVQTLAQSPVSEVMKHWAGLGYYRRARMLHEAAKTICKKYAGVLPQDTDELRKLPGIGRYTAGAIASIAYNQKAPVLDGNVIRVLSRVEAVSNDISQLKTLNRLWQLAEAYLPDENTGDFNQALMELGATVCFPENPRCGTCPVASLCKAHRFKKEPSFPFNSRREKLLKKNSFTLVLRANGRVLMRRQPTEARWGGLWMFPYWESREAMLQDHSLICTEVGSTAKLKQRMSLTHGFTKYRIKLSVYESRLPDKVKSTHSILGDKNARWIPVAHLPKYALPSPHQKIADEISKDV